MNEINRERESMSTTEYAHKIKNLEKQISEERQKNDKKEKIFAGVIFSITTLSGVIFGLYLSIVFKDAVIATSVFVAFLCGLLGFLIGVIFCILIIGNKKYKVLDSLKEEFSNVTKEAIEEDLKNRYNVESIKDKERLEEFNYFVYILDPDLSFNVKLKNGEKYNVTLDWNKDKARVKVVNATKIFELKENNVSEDDTQKSTPFDVIESLSKVDEN